MTEHRISTHRSAARRLSRIAATVLGGLATTAIAAALTMGSATAAAAADADSGGAWVRAAHLVPGLGTMTISLTPFQGSAAKQSAAATAPGVTPAPATAGMFAIASAAGYGAITDYRQVPPGFYTVAVRPVGAAASSAPMITGTLEAKSGKAFTVAGVGTKSSPRVTTLADDLTPPPAGRARVRLLPAANTARTVTVTARNGPTVARDAAFGEPTGYATVPAGTWRLQATGGDTATGSSVTLDGGSVYTLLILDSGKKLKITPVLDASGVDAMPSGGAQTGGGWMAQNASRTGDSEGSSRLLLAGGLGTAAAVAAMPVLITYRRRRSSYARSAPGSS